MGQGSAWGGAGTGWRGGWGGARGGDSGGMGFITRSGTALVALAGAAVLYALGALCLAAAYVGLTPSDQHMVGELTHAGDWLRFAGGLVALAAVCEASWPIVADRAREGATAGGRAREGTNAGGRAREGTTAGGRAREGAYGRAHNDADERAREGTGVTRVHRVGRRVLVKPLGESPHHRPHVETPAEIATDTIIAALGTLLVALGLLITAAHGRTNDASGVISALGFTTMGLLLLWRSNDNAPELVAGLATLGFAVGYAMVAITTGPAEQVAAGLLEAAAVATIAGTVIAARPREYLWTGAGRVPFLRPVVGGLLLLTVAFVAAAIVSGIVYSGNATLADIRVGPAIAYTLEGAGIAMFGWAAAWRVALANRMQHAR
jgi:hypothetical protein